MSRPTLSQGENGLVTFDYKLMLYYDTVLLISEQHLYNIELFYWHVQNQRLLTQQNYVTRPFVV